MSKFDKLSVKELLNLRAQLDVAIVEAKDREKQVVLAKLSEEAASAGFTLREIFGSHVKRFKTSAKHGKSLIRNPSNPYQTWAGGQPLALSL